MAESAGANIMKSSKIVFAFLAVAAVGVGGFFLLRYVSKKSDSQVAEARKKLI